MVAKNVVNTIADATTAGVWAVCCRRNDQVSETVRQKKDFMRTIK